MVRPLHRLQAVAEAIGIRHRILPVLRLRLLPMDGAIRLGDSPGPAVQPFLAERRRSADQRQARRWCG